MSINGKVVLITGASDVPGNIIAVALARAGAKVAVEGVALVQERVLRVVETFGGEALPVRGSLTNSSDVSHVLSNIEAIMGPVDILVNSAGSNSSKSLEAISPEEWKDVLASRAEPAFLCTQAITPGMKDRGFGHVISVCPDPSTAGGFNSTVTAASTHALIGFSNSLGRELSGTGIRVSLLYTEGPINGQAHEESGGIDPEDIAQEIIHIVSQGNQASSAQTTIHMRR